VTASRNQRPAPEEALEQSLEAARLVADAVLYEGYLLYPYRASAEKNQLRWQFGILGPPGAARNTGEPAEMSAQCLLIAPLDGRLSVRLRFLQLQSRNVEARRNGTSGGAEPACFEQVSQLEVGAQRWMSWDEAVPHELVLGPFGVDEFERPVVEAVSVCEGTDIESLQDLAGAEVGRVVRRRQPLRASVSLSLAELPSATLPDAGMQPLYRLHLTVTNTLEGPIAGRAEALAGSFLGAHLLLSTDAGRFVSLLDPPDQVAAEARSCEHNRCWPVLASDRDDVLLVSPIILYDHPAVAAESAGALFDSTEIDEILTLRIMTMTEAEKAEARATDPHAASIIDRCESMSPDAMQRLHGVLRNPHLDRPTASRGGSDPGQTDPFEVPTWADTDGAPWWDPAVDASVSPETDRVFVSGVALSRGSRVRLQPNRRADAQDLFFAGQDATVAAVYADVDGNDHVAVVLTDDPAADLHEWYGRYLYFAPDELEPLAAAPSQLTQPQPHEHESQKG
jgi:hypothetical protein